MINWTLVRSFTVTSSAEQFWKSIDIFIKRSHIINRRLVGEEILGTVAVTNDEHLEELRGLIFSLDCDEKVKTLLSKQNTSSEFCKGQQNRSAYIKKLLPKNVKSSTDVFQIVVKDYDDSRVTFTHGLQAKDVAPNFTYSFSYDRDEVSVWVEPGVDSSNKSLAWIVTKVIPKLIKWMEHEEEEGASHGIKSLSLVGVTKYSTLYNKLKETYGKQLVEIWPENTDPLKFVYEDIGIATYLLLLWEDKPKQRFVDLGCGNGLLVHILNSEGHSGIGYDMRARKIWSMYPSSTRLEVRTIIPSSDTVFPETDWLIGNHSDELTVWIPVMAARSSFSCNFFLLPCCPYNFDGKKYCRANSSLSQYNDFLNYVEVVCNECGILPEKDKLRIPSTKRICFVGRSRNYSKSQYEACIGKLLMFVNSKCKMQYSSESEGVWCSQFTPRAEERVRNCTKVQRDVRESIITLVADELLAKRRLSPEGWNYGGAMELSSIATIVPVETLKKLKKECGGLQTLLKNHHSIFKVSGGKVEFRIPVAKVERDCSVWKKKPCWFYHNHPNKCPVKDEQCSFIHGS